MRRELLAEMAGFFEVDHVLGVGSGAVGICVALRALGARGTKVAIPAMTCPTVAMSVLAAGATPLAVDVSERDGNLSVEALTAVLDDSVSAIVAADAYGYPADWPALRRVADEHGCALVEDACQSYGGFLSGRPLGSYGDVAVISFGYSKAIWLNAGGMVLTGDAQIAADMRRVMRAPDYDLLSGVRSRFYLRLMRRDKLAAMDWLSRHAGLLRQGLPGGAEAALAERWPAFVAGLGEARRRLRDLGEVVAEAGFVRPFTYGEADWLPWRWTFLVEDAGRRPAVVAALNAAGLATSTLYGTADAYFSDVGRIGEDSAARRIADSLVNLKQVGSYCNPPDESDLRRRLQVAERLLES